MTRKKKSFLSGIFKPKKQIQKQENTKEVIPKQNIKISESNMLLKLAIDKDLDIQKLEKLIDLKNKEEQRKEKKEFNLNFAQMQKDFIPAQKSKAVMDHAGNILYTYCSLEDILKVYQPIITRHGFSYRWNETSIKEGKGIEISCIVSGYGHYEITKVEVPVMPGNKFTNIIQQRGSASTYGKRYSFMDAFGIIIEGEDNDANIPQSKTIVRENVILPKKNKEKRDKNKMPLGPVKKEERITSESIQDEFVQILKMEYFSDDDRKNAGEKMRMAIKKKSIPDMIVVLNEYKKKVDGRRFLSSSNHIRHGEKMKTEIDNATGDIGEYELF